VIINWYSKLHIVVRWNNCLFVPLRVRSGVRQGGMLSPSLFNVYADTLISNIVSSRSGCHVNQYCMACVMYADDLLLLSASVTGLQELINICVSSSKDLCLTFNENKSYCIVVGPRTYDKLAEVCVDGNALKWTNSTVLDILV